MVNVQTIRSSVYAKKIITGEDYEKIVSGVLNGEIPTSGCRRNSKFDEEKSWKIL